ncbi:MAG: hypothetical protein WCG55_01850 [bacterium]
MKTYFSQTIRLVAIVVFFVASSSVVFAAGTTTATGYCSSGVPSSLIGGSHNVTDVIKYFACFIEQSIVPFLFAVAIVIFMYGVVKFIGTQESSEREAGKQFMLWGIIALAVMFSVWGITTLVGSTFGIHNVIPQLPVD